VKKREIQNKECGMCNFFRPLFVPCFHILFIALLKKRGIKIVCVLLTTLRTSKYFDKAKILI